MSSIIRPIQIDYLYNRGEITLTEANDLRGKWDSLSSEEQNKVPRTIPKDRWKEEWSNVSDSEIQIRILKNLRKINASNNSLKGWVTFLGIIQIIAIIGAILFSIN